MPQDTVYRVTRNSDSSHTEMARLNEPHSELPQFWEIPKIDRVMCVT